MVRLLKLPVVVSVGAVLLILLLARPASAPPTWVSGPWNFVGTAEWVQVVDSDGDGWAINETSVGAVSYASVNFDPSDCQCLKFKDLTELSASFNGPTGGGAPRFSIGIDLDHSGLYDDSDPSIFVYFGPAPNFISNTLGWQSTGNLIGVNDGRWDTSQISGGKWGDTYDHTRTLLGDECVVDFELVVDAGWAQPDPFVQNVLVDNVRISGGSCGSNVLTEKPQQAPGPTAGHVGGEMFTANKLAISSPYLALIGVVAVAWVVLRRRPT